MNDPENPAKQFGAADTTLTATQLAADRTTFTVWDWETPFPLADEMRDLDVVTHVNVERGQQGGYHYLHECAIAHHAGRFHACWANHPLWESNETDEIIRGSTSTDGITWSQPTTWVAPPLAGGHSYNHSVLATHNGKLHGFLTRWIDRKPGTMLFILNDATGQWEPTETHIPGFIPFAPPTRMADGNWIMGGEEGWWEAAVAVSHGDDWSKWDFIKIPRPTEMKLKFPETAIINQGDRLIALCRPFKQPTAPVSVSTDFGRTWDTLRLSNFPLGPSQPYAGVLSTGHQYLLTNSFDHGRALLTIAIADPGSRVFTRIRKLRHQQWPKRRLFGGIGEMGDKRVSYVGRQTEWSYPAAIEHDGKLHIIYTHGKEDAVLSIVPVSVLVRD